MKTDFVRMSEVYRAYLDDTKPGPADGCQAPEDLVRLVTGRVRRKERARIMEHVARCGDCARIMRSLLRLSGEVDGLTGKAGALRGKPEDEASGKTERFGPHLNRRAAVAVFAGLIGLTVITFSVIKLAERPVFRGTVGPQVRLISPKQGAALAAGKIELKWEEVPKASRYAVELFDRSLEKVWRSGPMAEARVELPEDARGVILAGETYFWRVTAILQDGRELVSKLGEFSVKK